MPFWYQVTEIRGLITYFSSWSKQISIKDDDGYEVTLVFPGEKEVRHFMIWILVDNRGDERPDSDIVGMEVKLHYDKKYYVTDFS